MGYSTYLGGQANDYGYGLTVRPDGTAYVTGKAQSRDFPTTPGAYDRTANGSDDVFVARLSRAEARLLLGTYLGGAITTPGMPSGSIRGAARWWWEAPAPPTSRPPTRRSATRSTKKEVKVMTLSEGDEVPKARTP